MRAALLIFGAVIEFAGIVLVASTRFRDRRTASVRMARLFAIAASRTPCSPPSVSCESITVPLGMAGELTLAGSLSAVKTVSNVETLEQKVEFLLRRDREAQRDVNELRDRLRAVEGETAVKLDAARAEIENHVAAALRTAHEAYLPLRIVGVCALVVGLGLATAGNFAS